MDLHPLHTAYLQRLPINTMEQFLSALDQIEPDRRRSILGDAWLWVEPIKEPEIPKFSYDKFRETCRVAAEAVRNGAPIEGLIIIGLTSAILESLSRLGNVDTAEDSKGRVFRFIEDRMEKDAGADIDWLVEHMSTMPEQASKTHADYLYFCEHVLTNLLTGLT